MQFQHLKAAAAAIVMTVLIGAAAQGASAAPPSGGPIIKEITDGIAKSGAKATVKKLYDTDRWGAVESHIAAGEPEWIALAAKLAPGSDASTAEGLGISLAYALPKKPSAVLQIVSLNANDVLGVDKVCGLPFIEPAADEIAAYKRQAPAAVRAVADPKLEKAKAACLAQLEPKH